jgi:UDP-4-amino-4,6-dideoxy-N-acetyl-beta-L-altrosamine transaminase
LSATPHIPYGRQSISDADIAAVEAVLRSDYLTQGPAVPRFEQALAQLCGAPHVVAANSATSALHIACAALDVGPGDLVWTVPNTFVASANCARYCGADVDFVDVEPGTWNLSVAGLEEKLVRAAAAGRLPKVVIPVAFTGQPCRMAEIRELADRYHFKVIEDASHAIGASYQGRPVGGGREADITVFSFHPVKIITTAEGGAAVTHDDRLASRMARLRTHGITRDPADMEGPSEGPWYYQMIELGWNYRMTDMQAALGLSQMARLSSFVARRRQLADRYDRLLAGSGLTLPARTPGVDSAWHLYVVVWDEEGTGKSRRVAFEELRAAGIGVNVHYIPVHLQPYYRRLGFRPGQFPVAEEYYRRAISIPLHAELTDAEQDRVVAALQTAARR